MFGDSLDVVWRRVWVQFRGCLAVRLEVVWRLMEVYERFRVIGFDD